MNKHEQLAHLHKFGIFLNDHPVIANLFRVKAAFIQSIRTYLNGIGAIELEMPNLQMHREGAPVHQFVTTHPLTGERFYLRHSMEDHLRRICDAFGQVYELGKAFRVEVESEYRANEFLLMEYVGKDVEYEQGLRIVEGLVAETVLRTFGTYTLEHADFTKIQRLSFDQLMQQTVGHSIYDKGFREKSFAHLQSLGVNLAKHVLDWEIYEELLKHVLEPSLMKPTIIVDYPVALKHVAEVDPQRQIAKRFSVVVKGIEVCDGGVKFSSSDKYREVYESNATYRQNNLGIIDNELPQDFFDDIDYSQSRVFTFGLGVDRLFAICMGKNIHEVTMFPHH